MRTMHGAAVAVTMSLLVMSGCGGRKGAAGMVRSSALGTFPRDTAALLVLEVKKVRALHPDVPWIKDMASLADREGGPFQEVIRRLGPDVLARLERLSLAVVPQPDRMVGYAVLAEGAFDGARVREALGGADRLTLVETEQMDFSVALLPDNSLALGPKRVLDTMRDNGASRGHGLDANAAILAPLEKVRQEAQFWGALDCRSLQRLFKEASASSDLGRMPLESAPVQSLVSIAFRGMVGDSVNLDVYGQTDAEANARTLADAARGLVALGRVGAGRDQAKEWLEFLDGIHVDQRGSDVTLRASIPAKTMESFVAQMMSAKRPAAEGPSAEPAPGPTAVSGQAGRAPGRAPASAAPPPSKAATRAAPSAPAPAPAAPAGSPPPKDSPSRPAPDPRGTQKPSAGVP
jgi:hypothetical protein